MFILEQVPDIRISPDKDDIREVLWCLKQVSPFDKYNHSIGSIATSVMKLRKWKERMFLNAF